MMGLYFPEDGNLQGKSNFGRPGDISESQWRITLGLWTHLQHECFKIISPLEVLLVKEKLPSVSHMCDVLSLNVPCVHLLGNNNGSK